MNACPLCNFIGPFTQVTGPENRRLLFCRECSLVFTPGESLPSPETEKARYLLHRNDIDDPGYAKFLEQAIVQTRPYFREGSRVLDFGCGPRPALSVLLERAGLSCDNYDPFFYPEFPAAGAYGLIFAIETFEHFHWPEQEIRFISRLLAPDGMLTVMTEKWTTLEAFSQWCYAHDRTHVIFFHEDTFTFISRKFGFDLVKSNNPRVTLLRRT